ncbi:hypothetical protein [Actinoalloteichus spitiensis]|uniref:hypothetical protein n=1 Tax=Actinoalloteichus spitiensis TaxID=252394 RepID=UPI00036AF1E8|nr:hypothetical protein [Actinoalloteichus spitiensis]
MQPSPARHEPDDTRRRAERLRQEVLSHPAVERLDETATSTVDTLLPGARIRGVAVGEAGERVAVAVVLRFGASIPQVVQELRSRARAVVGAVPVDVTVADVVVSAEPPAPRLAGGR